MRHRNPYVRLGKKLDKVVERKWEEHERRKRARRMALHKYRLKLKARQLEKRKAGLLKEIAVMRKIAGKAGLAGQHAREAKYLKAVRAREKLVRKIDEKIYLINYQVKHAR